MDDILKSEVSKYLSQNDLFRLSSLNKSFRIIMNKRSINLNLYDDFQLLLHLSHMNLEYNIYWDNKYSLTLNQLRDYYHQIKNLHIKAPCITEVFRYPDLNLDTLIINIVGEQNPFGNYIRIDNINKINNIYIYSTSFITLHLFNENIKNIYMDRYDNTIAGKKAIMDRIIYL